MVVVDRISKSANRAHLTFDLVGSNHVSGLFKYVGKEKALKRDAQGEFWAESSWKWNMGFLRMHTNTTGLKWLKESLKM